MFSQEFPGGSQEALRMLPGGSQEAPKRLPGGSQEPRMLPGNSPGAPRNSLELPGACPQETDFGHFFGPGLQNSQN